MLWQADHKTIQTGRLFFSYSLNFWTLDKSIKYQDLKL